MTSKTQIVATGCIAYDDQAIWGIGVGVHAALDQAAFNVENIGVLVDMRTMPATQALLDFVHDFGGHRTFEVINGVACTPDEAKAVE